jgi:hypothetical protein
VLTLQHVYAQKAAAHTSQNPKELKRELSHRDWLEQNLKNTDLLRQSRRRVLELHTEKAKTHISNQN